MDYAEFLQRKTQHGADKGFFPNFMPDEMFDFQRALTTWAVEKGRAAIFADCGLGKTLMQLTWAQNVYMQTGKPVLVLTPLAVSGQTVREAEKFGIVAARSQDGSTPAPITVTNYERLDKFDSTEFGGCVCDESSILKGFDGKRKEQITRFMWKLPYRLLATATAAPNDYTELGTSSEALGYMGLMDMLNRFFVNNQNNSATNRMFGETAKWRFKGHAEGVFWRWVTSWARACRKPSDIGFDNGAFELPTLTERNHIIEPKTAPDGELFNMPAFTLEGQRNERKRTITERCQKVAELVDHDRQSMVWCHYNYEGAELARVIPDSVEISGADSDEKKEEVFLAFADGQIKTLITKPKIGAWGLNFQNCNHVVTFPSHSYEQYYQSVRRCWRFGQEREVTVDRVLTVGEKAVLANLEHKSEKAAIMFDMLVELMNDSLAIERKDTYTKERELPAWV